jgi:hypothetical protein
MDIRRAVRAADERAHGERGVAGLNETAHLRPELRRPHHPASEATRHGFTDAVVH